MSEIVWEDPPPHNRVSGHSIWLRRLTPLIEHPNRWARVAAFDSQSGAGSAAGHLKRGVLKSPPGRWEFVSRGIDGKFYVYARYLGPEKKGRGK